LVAVDNRIFLVDMRRENKPRQLGEHQKPVTCGSFTLDGRTAMTGNSQGDVAVWDIESRELRNCFNLHDTEVLSVAVSPSGKFAVSGGGDGSLVLWKVENGKRYVLKKANW